MLDLPLQPIPASSGVNMLPLPPPIVRCRAMPILAVEFLPLHLPLNRSITVRIYPIYPIYFSSIASFVFFGADTSSEKDDDNNDN